MWSINIYMSEDDIIKINFRSKDEKVRYVKNELNFCKNELIDRQKAITKSERIEAYKPLSSKKLTYALSSGYKPLTPNSKEYWYNEVNDAEIA